MSATLPPEDGDLSEEQLRAAITALESLPLSKELQPVVRAAIRDLKIIVELPGPRDLAPIARLRAILREMTS